MTTKLYENNALLKECTAVVTACTEKNGQYLVELDQTVFFPEGGGQLSDRGKLGPDGAMVDVLHVSEKDGHIYHECAAPLAVGTAVKAVIDWTVRLDRMQQHCGEHILSYACWKLFGANNIGFHMNEDQVFIDLDKDLTEEELLQAELLTNEIIWDNRPISIQYMDSTEAVQLKDKMRKFNSKLTGLLRIVSVQDADVCTCCGTHPPYTGMVGSVKVIRHEKHKGGIRVEFLCGRRALLDADMKNATLLETAHSMSIKPGEVPAAVAKLKADLAAQAEAIQERLVAAAEDAMNEAYNTAGAGGVDTLLKGSRLAIVPLAGYDAKTIKKLIPVASDQDEFVTILAGITTERINYAVVASSGSNANAGAIIKVVNEVFGGRGGGKTDCAQGGSDYVDDWKDKLVAVEEQLTK